MGTGNTRAVQKHEIHSEKITFWCAIHSEVVLDTYCFNHETVRKEDYCESLKTYVRNKGQNFPENALLKQAEVPPHTSRDACVLLQLLFEKN